MKITVNNPIVGLSICALFLLGYFAFISFSLDYDKNVRFSLETSKARLAMIQNSN